VIEVSQHDVASASPDVKEFPMSPDLQQHNIHATVPPHDLIQQLRALNEKLPGALQAQILATGRSIVPELIVLLEEALADDEVDHSWAPAHAAKLLGMLGDRQAVPVLLRFLEHYDVLGSYHQEAADALVELGDMAIDACLEAYPTASNEDMRDGIASVLRRSKTKDERIYQTLLDFFEQTPELGGMYLADYGDPRAIPVISHMFDALPVDDRENAIMSNHVFVELRGAIEELGGQLTAAQEAKIERADAPRRRFVAHMDAAVKRMAAQQRRTEQAAPILSHGTGAARQQRKLGRNERCWCGSGKKYKKCHLDLDR
jgi:NADPH-dependent ferric siderophore reductase